MPPFRDFHLLVTCMQAFRELGQRQKELQLPIFAAHGTKDHTTSLSVRALKGHVTHAMQVVRQLRRMAPSIAPLVCSYAETAPSGLLVNRAGRACTSRPRDCRMRSLKYIGRLQWSAVSRKIACGALTSLTCRRV